MINSEYRLMWMMVLFDLPVTSKAERQRATKFRQYLLDEGFTMSQFSVYLRFIGSREKCDAFIRRIKTEVPTMGKVSILCFTDKQFGTIKTFYNANPKKPPEIPAQLQLF